MSLAAVPAYYRSHGAVGKWWALGAAVARRARPVDGLHRHRADRERLLPGVPPRRVLALVLVLERPTLARQALLLASGSRSRRGCRRSRSCRRSLTAPAAARAVRALDPSASAGSGRPSPRRRRRRAGRRRPASLRGRPVERAARRLRGRRDAGYDVGDALHYLLYHWAELDLYLGVVPIAATIVLRGDRARRSTRRCSGCLAASARRLVLARARRRRSSPPSSPTGSRNGTRSSSPRSS